MNTKSISFLLICIILLSDIDVCYSHRLQRLKRKAKSSHRHLSKARFESSTYHRRNSKNSRLKRTKGDPFLIAAYIMEGLTYVVKAATFIVNYFADKKVDAMHNDLLTHDEKIREIKQNLAIEMIKSSQNYFNMILLNAIFGFIQLKQHSEKNSVALSGGENILISVKSMKIELENLEFIYVTGNNSFFGEENFFQARSNSLTSISGSLVDKNKFSYFSLFTKSIHLFLYRALMLLIKVMPDIAGQINVQVLQIPDKDLEPFTRVIAEYNTATKNSDLTNEEVTKYLVCSAKVGCSLKQILQDQNKYEDLVEETYKRTIPLLKDIDSMFSPLFLAFKTVLLLIHLGYWLYTIIYFITQFLRKQEIVPNVTFEDDTVVDKNKLWNSFRKDFFKLIDQTLEFQSSLEDKNNEDDINSKSLEFISKVTSSYSKSNMKLAFKMLYPVVLQIIVALAIKSAITSILKEISVVRMVMAAIDLIVAIYKLVEAILRLVKLSKENKDNKIMLNKIFEISSKHSELILCKFHIVIHDIIDKFSGIMMEINERIESMEYIDKFNNIIFVDEELNYDIDTTNESNNEFSELIKAFSENSDKKLDYFIYGICIISPIFCSQYLNEKLLLQSGVSSEMGVKIMDFANSMANYGPINVAFLKMRNLDFSTVGTVDKDYYSFLSTQKFYTSVNYISLYSNNANIIYQRGSKCSYGLKQIGLVKYDDTDHFKQIITDIPTIKSKFTSIFGNSVSVAIQIYEQANEKKKIEKFVLAFIYGRADFCSFSGIAPQKISSRSLLKRQNVIQPLPNPDTDTLKYFTYYFKFSLERVTELKIKNNDFYAIDISEKNYWVSQGIEAFDMEKRSWSHFLGTISYYTYSKEASISGDLKSYLNNFNNCIQLIILKVKECSNKLFFLCKAVDELELEKDYKITTEGNNNSFYISNTEKCQNLIKPVTAEKVSVSSSSSGNIGSIIMGISDIKFNLGKMICEDCNFITAADKISSKFDAFENLLMFGNKEILPMKWKKRHNPNKEFALIDKIPFLKNYKNGLNYIGIKFIEKTCSFNCLKIPRNGQIKKVSEIIQGLFKSSDSQTNAIILSEKLPEIFTKSVLPEFLEGFALHSTFEYKHIKDKSIYHPTNLFAFNSVVDGVTSSLDDRKLVKFSGGIEINHKGGLRFVIPAEMDFVNSKINIKRLNFKSEFYNFANENFNVFNKMALETDFIKGDFFALSVENIPNDEKNARKLELHKENMLYFEIYITRPLNEGYLEFDTHNVDSYVSQFLDKHWLPYFEINNNYNESESFKKGMDDASGPEPFTIPSHYFLSFPVSDDWSLNTRIWVRHSYNSPKEYDEICSTGVLNIGYLDGKSNDNSLLYDEKQDWKRKTKISMMLRRSNK